MNRRSLGMKESGPPRRMRSIESRSNEYNFGSQNNMESVGRNSRPQSRSMAPQIQPPSTGKRTASQSRLPMPGLKGKGPTATKRSSSSGAPMQERNVNRQMTTPTTRSSSGHSAARGNSGTRSSKRESCITPQRYQGSNRKSYSSSKLPATGLTGAKINMGGQRLSGRGSAIGAKGCKDTRPLTDKSYQQSQVRKVLDFLRKNNYANNALTSKHFPLSSKEFVSVFNFLYSFLQPDNLTAIPYQRFEESILPLLKSLGYPGNLSKSNFLTLGSMHSWPTVLGSLAFLCDMAIIYIEKLSPNIIPIGFVNKDEQGFALDTESEEKITFFHFIDCFQEFNDGADEFPEQLKNLEDNLMENLGVNIDNMQYMQQKEIGLRNQLTQIESTPSQKIGLMEQYQNLEGDKEKLLSYNMSMETHLKKIANEKELQLRIEEDLTHKLQILEGEIQELREICKSGSVPSLEAERSSVMVGDYRRQVEQAKNNAEEVDKEIFQQEIKVSRAREALEGIAKQFNGLSVEEGIGGEQPILLSVPVFRGGELVEEEANARLRPDLTELLKSRRATTRNTEREVQAEVVKAEQLEDVLRQKKSEETQKKVDVKNLQEEITAYREMVEKEDAVFDAQITTLKEALHRIRSQEGVDFQAKNRHLTHLEEKLAQAKMKQQVEHKKGLDFLERVCERTVTYMEECTKHRDGAAKSVVEQSLSVANTIKNSIIQMNAKVDSAVKAVEKNL